MSCNVLRAVRRMASWLLAAIAVCTAMPAHAHVHWSRVNAVDADTVTLYHFNNVTTSTVPAEPPLDGDLALTPTSAQVQLTTASDTPGAIFAPHSLLLPATGALRTTATVASLGGDLTVECWFKWLPTVTSATLEVGLQSGAKIRVARDVSTPSHDRFGVAATHGAFISANGFTNWAAVGEEEASLNEWRHLALAIHSGGLIYDAVQGHDVYAPGSVARIYLNGHAVGIPSSVIDVAGLPVHDASRITVTLTGGGMAIDELAVWRRDWTANGTVSNPFGNGRGVQSGIDNAFIYD